MSTSPIPPSIRPFVGVATPQANPTVEIEMRALLDEYAIPLATRLTSDGETPAERLVAYLEQIDVAIRSFDTLELYALLFACTGSSYLAGREREAELVGIAELEFGIPVITATRAIAREIRNRRARKIAILAPYPAWLIEESVRYWTEQRFNVVSVQRIDVGDDTRAIYALGDEDVAAALARFDAKDADLILLSGTGMPTLAAIRRQPRRLISSNACLANEISMRLASWQKADNASENGRER